jgi:hypothetical protein
MFQIEANFSDRALWEMEPVPIFMEEVVVDGKKCRAFKADFMREFQMKMRRVKLERTKKL